MTLEHKIKTSFIRKAASFIGRYACIVGLGIAALAAYSCGSDMQDGNAADSYSEISESNNIVEDTTPEIHPYVKTCLKDGEKGGGDGYPLKEDNKFVEWDKECPKGYKYFPFPIPPWDCNDSVKSIHPKADELCNNIDDDCDGNIDEGIKVKCFTGCGEGKFICVDGKYAGCDAPTKCCTPGSITDAVSCPYTPGVYLFVIDNSGSMSTSDPNKLRYKGAIKFIGQIEDEEKSGLIVYSSYASIVGEITNNKEEITNYLNNAINKSPDGETNIPGAMYLALEEINTHSERKIIILLTDGQSNIGTFDPSQIRNEAEYQGITIFSLGLGTEVNNSDLEQIATQNGDYYFINSANDIASIYDTIFKTTKYESWKLCGENKQWLQKFGECE